MSLSLRLKDLPVPVTRVNRKKKEKMWNHGAPFNTHIHKEYLHDIDFPNQRTAMR